VRRPLGPSRITGDAGAGWGRGNGPNGHGRRLARGRGHRATGPGAFSHQASSLLTDAGSRVITSVFAIAEGARLVACAIALVLLLRPGRHKDDEDAYERWRPPVPWWATTLVVLFALAMLAAPWIILLVGRAAREQGATRAGPPVCSAPGTGHLITPSEGSPVWPLLAGVIIAAAAVLAPPYLPAVAVTGATRRRRTGPRDQFAC
jgi:hypothetical protein